MTLDLSIIIMSNLFHNVKFDSLKIDYSSRQSFHQVEFLHPRILKSDQKSDHYQGYSEMNVEKG